MSEGLQAILNDDGVFEEYDDTYDFTIHCESEEEQEEVLNKLNWRWIPVSERLPKEYDLVLVTEKYGFVDTARFVHNDFTEMNEWIVADDETIDVIAWMPLPHPYKGESEE